MDGGVIHKTDIAAAIYRCMETVDHHSDITMDVILTENAI